MRLTPEFYNLLNELLRQPSVVGAEHAFFRVLQRALEERGAQVTWYEGLLVAQGRKPDSIHFSAHIDRHGLICTGPSEFQYAAFVTGARSDLLGNSVSETLMLKVADRYAGLNVYAYEPWSGSYRGGGVITGTRICPQRNNLIFEINDLDHLVAGTPIALSDKLKVDSAKLSGQLDNVLSAALLIHLFGTGFEGTAFFTAQEEAGKSWRYLLEWYRRFGNETNNLIVLDTSPFESEKDIEQVSVILRNQDANAVFSQQTTANLEKYCHSMGIKYLYKDSYIEQRNKERTESKTLGSTELGRIISASNGLVTGTTLQIPTTNYHTLYETASISACEDILELMHILSGI